MMYDVVIIGAGPAGISAGIYAASRGKKVLITEKNTVGGLIGKVSTVTHYAGIMTEETGSSFAKRLKIQAENTGMPCNFPIKKFNYLLFFTKFTHNNSPFCEVSKMRTTS